MKRLLLIPTLFLGACALEPVAPLERAILLRPEMRWDAGLMQEGTMRAHTYASKEASGSGAAHSASGCGCN